MWSKRHALAEIVAIVGFLLLLPAILSIHGMRRAR
jgi:hypothetical protein